MTKLTDIERQFFLVWKNMVRCEYVGVQGMGSAVIKEMVVYEPRAWGKSTPPNTFSLVITTGSVT